MKGLYTDSIFKSFGNRQVLTDIFLNCRRGDIIGLLGRNGSGKSTLLKIIFGSLKAEEKHITVDDLLIRNFYYGRDKVKYLPQDSFLPDHMKIRNIIGLMCDSGSVAELRETDLINKFMNFKAARLSAGEKRMVEVLIIIYSKAEFLLLDEPFNGLAPVVIQEIKEIIIKRSKFKGFIISDHDYKNIMHIATRNLLLFDGGLKEIENIQDLQEWGYLKD